jgi:hypothetical protein
MAGLRSNVTLGYYISNERTTFPIDSTTSYQENSGRYTRWINHTVPVASFRSNRIWSFPKVRSSVMIPPVVSRGTARS